MTDTDRLNYLLGFLEIEDAGDAHWCPLVFVDYERLTNSLRPRTLTENLRDVIDRALKETP